MVQVADFWVLPKSNAAARQASKREVQEERGQELQDIQMSELKMLRDDSGSSMPRELLQPQSCRVIGMPRTKPPRPWLLGRCQLSPLHDGAAERTGAAQAA